MSPTISGELFLFAILFLESFHIVKIWIKEGLKSEMDSLNRPLYLKNITSIGLQFISANKSATLGEIWSAQSYF